MSGKVRDYTILAKDILEAVGGEENVIGASRRATRLRLVLKRSTPKAKDIVKSMLPSRRHYGCHGYAYKACDWPAFSVELLAHIGLDRVTLDGTSFSLKVKEGDTVKKGEVLVEFDKLSLKRLRKVHYIKKYLQS
nr:PTS glucose transporter subunit IIA [Bacillus subtilis]WGD75898.1 PTS glucose transporter subunit IIA [Bacillus subtilis]